MRQQRRAMRIGRMRRGGRPLRVAGAAAFRWLATFTSRGERRQARREQAMLRSAEDVTAMLGEMKGAAMKLGQVISMMTGAVPPEMAVKLADLHSDAPPMAHSLVRQVFMAEFGKPPEKIFRRFNYDAFAAASIGQVHRAETYDGCQVAVKVQYPGVEEAIQHDMANISVLFRLGGLMARGLDMDVLIRDIGEGITGELDYLGEAQRQQEFYDRYRGHAFVVVPRVFHEHTTRRVLTMDYIDGLPFSAVENMTQAERNRIGEMIYRFAFGSIYRHGLFNGDPHPGNYRLLRDGRLAFLDYGQVSRFPDLTVERFANILRALLDRDIERWRVGCEELGILLRNAPYSTEVLFDHMRWFWAPILEDEVEMTAAIAGEMVKRNAQTTGHGGAINQWCSIPEGLVFLTRINFGLAGVLAALKAKGPWRAITAEYVLEGLEPCTELGRASAATSRGPGI